MASSKPKYPPNLGISGTIQETPFSVIMDKFKPYMMHLSGRYAHQIGLAEDTYQELSIVLWKCYQRYKEKPTNQFVALSRSSMNNRIIDLARKKIPWTFSECPKFQETDVSVIFTGAVVGADFYEHGIEQIKENGGQELKDHIENAVSRNIRPKVRTKKLLAMIGEAVS